MSDNRTIVLCATQRSGSTLVCEDLRNNDLGLAEEHFIPFVKREPPDGVNTLARVRQRGTDAGGIFSVKVMAGYAGKVDALLRRNDENASAKHWNALARKFEQALWVHLDRRSIVRQAISQTIVGKVGFAHALSGEGRLEPGLATTEFNGIFDRKITIDDRKLDDLCLDIVKERELWERFFFENEIEPVRLIYEDIVDDATYLRGIIERLGIKREVINSDRKLMKIGNATNEKVWREYLSAKNR